MLRNLIIAGGVLCAAPAYAQTQTDALGAKGGQASAETVVVSALRFGQREDESPTSITVITSADIARRGLNFASDALATAPGVNISQAGAFGGVASARIRGNAVGQTLVLVDGVPVNDVAAPGAEFDFGSFTLGDVERIEILRGPQSTLWGANAIGGVVNIVSKAATPGFGWNGRLQGGSYNTWGAGAGISGGADAASGRLDADWLSSDGISKADKRNGNSEKDPYSSLTLSGRGEVKLAPGWKLAADARWTAADIDFDGFPPPFFNLADTNDSTRSRQLAAATTLSGKLFEDRLDNSLQVARTELDRKNYAGSRQTSRNKGERWTYRYTGGLDVAAGHKAGFGVEHEDSKADGHDASVNSVFGFYQWSPIKTVALSGGVRYDDDDRYGSATTGKAGASWKLSDAVRLRAAWGQGFRPPTIFQTSFICSFCLGPQPAPNLKAETSDAVEAGGDFSFGRVVVAATVYDQRTENLISFTSRGYQNVALAKQRGWEVSLDAPILSWLGVRAGYAYIDASDGAGKALPRVPMHSGDIEFDVAPPGPISGALTARFNGKQSDGFGPDVPGWMRLDAAATWAISTRLEAFVRVENLLDRRYQQIGGYGEPGLSGLIGVRIRS